MIHSSVDGDSRLPSSAAAALRIWSTEACGQPSSTKSTSAEVPISLSVSYIARRSAGP